LAKVPDGDPAVTVGPAVGEDAAVIEVPAASLVATTDPITLTSSAAGRYAVIVNANDVAVSGAPPRWFLLTVLLPLCTDVEEVGELFAEVVAALADVGAVLVGGHTEITPAVTQPVLVGQMLGVVAAGRMPVSTADARPGDVVVQVGGVPVEGAAVLATERRDRLADLPSQVVAVAAGAAVDPGIPVVGPALLAAELGASAMHDPTEGGLAAGLHELATASGAGVWVRGADVDWFAPGVDVCRGLGADPWATLGSGCLLATFAPDRVVAALRSLDDAGHRAVAVGEMTGGPGVEVDGVTMALPDRDEVARLLEGADGRRLRSGVCRPGGGS